MEYFFIVAMLLIPGGEKDTTNYTAVPFTSLEQCQTYLENPDNNQLLVGSLKQYLRVKYGAMSVSVMIEGMECRSESELEWNIPETPKEPVLMQTTKAIIPPHSGVSNCASCHSTK